MGYYTKHSLSILNPTGDENELDFHKQQLSTISGYDYLFDEDVKWYDRHEQMITHSKNHPDTIFVLKGDGEEQGDVWVQYFKNGLCQTEKPEIKFPDFDEFKLK